MSIEQNSASPEDRVRAMKAEELEFAYRQELCEHPDAATSEYLKLRAELLSRLSLVEQLQQQVAAEKKADAEIQQIVKGYEDRAEAAEAEAEKAKGERDYKEQEYEKLRVAFFKMADAKDTQIGLMREALRKLRVRCHAAINGGGLQQFNAQEALKEIAAALTPEPAQSTKEVSQ